MSVYSNNIQVDASGNATISGDLTVNGATTTVSTTNTVVSDKLIELGNGVSGTPSGDAGILVERGSSTNAAIVWDESEDRWVAATTSATGASTGDLTITPTDFNVSDLIFTPDDITTAGSLRIRATNNMHIGDDGADSIRLGRINTTAAKIHLRSGTDSDLVVTNSKVGIGTDSPGTLLHLAASTTDLTLQNTTIENTAGGCESKIIFEDHGDNSLGQIEVSHVGTADDEKGQFIISTNNDSGLQAALTIDEAQQVIVGEGKLVLNATAVTSTAAELNKLDGYTGSVTELNYLDTLHATGVTNTEFDYLDGVTSALQTQLDGKSPVAGHSSIATVGTIGTGTWQGTAIASAYLDADTAHLSGAQTFTGTKTLNSFKGTAGATVTNILDEDAMGSNSATALATQQSIKAYADTKSPVAGHSSIATVGTIGTGTWQGTAVASAYLDADTAHLSGTQTFTGTKTLNSFKGTGGATVTNILDEDAMGSDSATALATQQSIKAYADTKSLLAGSSSIVTTGTIGTGVWQGTAIASAYLDADTAHLSGTQTFSGAKTFSADVIIGGTTPKLTIGDAGAEDAMLAFDGNAVDFRVGLDDGTDTLEIGVGVAHGTTTALSISSLGFIKEAVLDAAPPDTTYSGISAPMVAGEDLEDGECVYAKSDGKMWKAVATASATSRTVAMCTADVSADAVGTFLLQGFAHFATNFPTYTVGGVLYTPEAEASSKNVPEQAAPDTDGDFVQVIGWAVSADIIYFNPSNDVIEVA